jgi:uncharacterized membrane protein
MRNRNSKKVLFSASIRFAMSALFTAILTLGASAQDGYTSFDPPLSVATYPSAINREGWICGFFGDGKFAHGFLRQANGAFITINPPSSLENWVTAINDAGDTVGYFDSFSLRKSLPGFIRHAAGNYTTFAVPHAYQTFPTGINSSRVVAGYATFVGAGSVGFLWGANHGFTLIQVPGSSPNTTVVTAINNAGAVTGSYYDSNFHLHGFIRSSNGHFTTFSIAGYPQTAPLAINSSGVTAGWTDDGMSSEYGFIRNPGGAYAGFGGGAHQGAEGSAINDNGVVVGIDSADNFEQAFIRDASGIFTLITLPFTNTFSTAYGINAAGQVTGNYTDSAGVIHGWVGTP